jgi:hypothetical protein
MEKEMVKQREEEVGEGKREARAILTGQEEKMEIGEREESASRIENKLDRRDELRRRDEDVKVRWTKRMQERVQLLLKKVRQQL